MSQLLNVTAITLEAEAAGEEGGKGLELLSDWINVRGPLGV